MYNHNVAALIFLYPLGVFTPYLDGHPTNTDIRLRSVILPFHIPVSPDPHCYEQAESPQPNLVTVPILTLTLNLILTRNLTLSTDTNMIHHRVGPVAH